MTTSGTLSRTARPLRRLNANWPALLLPVVAAGTLGLVGHQVPWLLIIAALLIAALAPQRSARLVPLAFFAYGAYGILLAHSLEIGQWQWAVYGLVHVGPADNVPWVLPQALACLALGTWLLAVTGAPGGGAVRRAVAQFRGTDGQPRTVPPLLLLAVLLLGEELFGNRLSYAGNYGSNPALPLAAAALIIVAGLCLVAWRPRAAAWAAVAGIVLLGLAGVIWSVRTLGGGAGQQDPFSVLFYGALALDNPVAGLLAGVQGIALLGTGCALARRLPTWAADADLARQAQALARRVDGLTRSRTDATETAMAELRRIERDLHDGAQARLVAVGMSLRAAEQLMTANPEAALALVTEARETSSRAIDDLRDLVRGIYPPVLADRGLADAVRALALDAVLDVDVHVDLRGEPPMPVAAAVYFAVAEALTNAVRHAGAGTAAISVEHAGGLLRATVTDDGHGGADAARGTGLTGVERRLAPFDGILAVSSPVGGPTIVAIEVPCALSSVKTSSC